KDARALQGDVDAKFLPRQRRRILDRGYLDLAVADTDGIARDRHLAGKPSMHGIEAQEVRVGFDRGKVVDAHNLDLVTIRFSDGAQHIASDSSEAVDRDPN